MTVSVADPAQGRIAIYVHKLLGDKPGPVFQAYSEPMTTSTAVGDLPTAENFSLQQNYPNPFNPSTTLTYDVPKNSNVTITLYNSFGVELGRLVEGMHSAGTHSVTLDASDMASGTYFVTMRAGDFVQTRTITLMK
jgi:hypothetical protein